MCLKFCGATHNANIVFSVRNLSCEFQSFLTELCIVPSFIQLFHTNLKFGSNLQNFINSCFFSCSVRKIKTILLSFRILFLNPILLNNEMEEIVQIAQTYSEHNKKSKMELFAKIINCFQPLFIFAKKLYLRFLIGP